MNTVFNYLNYRVLELRNKALATGINRVLGTALKS